MARARDARRDRHARRTRSSKQPDATPNCSVRSSGFNGIIELHRRIARGYRNRDNYRLRMLLVAGGLDHAPLPKVR